MWDQVQHSCASIVYSYGVDILHESSQRFMAQAMAYACVLSTDLLPCEATYGNVMSWINSYHGYMDVRDFGEYLKAADSALKTYVSNFAVGTSKVQPWSYERFKRSLSAYPNHIRHLAIVKEPLTRVLRECDPHSFRIVNTWFNFLRRVNLPGLDLIEQCEAEYIAFEEEMTAWSYDPALINSLNVIIRRWFTDFDLSGFVPKHGPGSVAKSEGSLPHFLKYWKCGERDLRLSYLQKDIGDLDTWFPWGSSEFYTDVPRPAVTQLERESELLCVPKSIITNRTISKEPAILQYFQQGYREAIYSYIGKHPYLRNHIDFSDQEASRRDAKEGSIFGDLSTIDLSSASDSVTTLLVKGLFRGTDKLLRGLICTRSDSTRLPSGQSLHLKKFAPMGSAVCFPVETIVFASCCELAKERAMSRYASIIADSGDGSRGPTDTLHVEWRVYGDDIIISEEATQDLYEILEGLHFKVNATKSFSGRHIIGNFREACGIEALDGFDVTPLRIPRFFRGVFASDDITPAEVAGAVSLANNAFDYGARNLRQRILHDLDATNSRLPWSVSGNYGLKTHDYCCTNFGTKSRLRLVASGNQRDCYQVIERYLAVVEMIPDCARCYKYRKCTPFNKKRCLSDKKCFDSTLYTRGNPFSHQASLPSIVMTLDEDDEDDPLYRFKQAVGYHEWLLRRSTVELDQEGCSFEIPDSQYVYNVLKQLATLRIADNSSAMDCPMRAYFRARWVYDLMDR